MRYLSIEFSFRI